MTGNLPVPPKSPTSVSMASALLAPAARKRRKWKTRESMTLYGRAYFFSKRVRMKTVAKSVKRHGRHNMMHSLLTGPAASGSDDICSAAISHKR